LDNNNGLWLGLHNEGVACYHPEFACEKTAAEHGAEFFRITGIMDMIFKAEQRCRSLHLYGPAEQYLDANQAGAHQCLFPNAARFKHFHKDITNETRVPSNTILRSCRMRGAIWAGTKTGR